jgi:hypothetical protein
MPQAYGMALDSWNRLWVWSVGMARSPTDPSEALPAAVKCAKPTP